MNNQISVITTRRSPAAWENTQSRLETNGTRIGNTHIRHFTLRLSCIAVFICMLLPLAAGQQEPPSIEQLASEVMELRAEMTQVRLEIEAARAARLGQEYAAATKDRQRLERRERSTYDEIAELDRQLSSPDLSAERRNELDLLRAEAMDVIARTKQKFTEAEHKESEIAKLLRAANHNVSVLLDRSKQRKP